MILFFFQSNIRFFAKSLIFIKDSGHIFVFSVYPLCREEVLLMTAFC